MARLLAKTSRPQGIQNEKNNDPSPNPIRTTRFDPIVVTTSERSSIPLEHSHRVDAVAVAVRYFVPLCAIAVTLILLKPELLVGEWCPLRVDADLT